MEESDELSQAPYVILLHCYAVLRHLIALHCRLRATRIPGLYVCRQGICINPRNLERIEIADANVCLQLAEVWKLIEPTITKCLPEKLASGSNGVS